MRYFHQLGIGERFLLVSNGSYYVKVDKSTATNESTKGLEMIPMLREVIIINDYVDDEGGGPWGASDEIGFRPMQAR